MMAQPSLTDYLSELQTLIDDKDGLTASELLCFRHPHIASRKLQLQNPESTVERFFDPPYDEMVAAHIRCTYAVANHDFVEAYACQTIVVQSFCKALQTQKDQNWSLPILFAVTLDLRLFANSADIQLTKKGRGKPGETLEKAADVLMGAFRICASDSRAAPQDSKKWGMLNLINQLFKIYFKINKLHLCKPLIRAVDNSNYKDEFSLSQQITYRYYVGRKAMFDSDFKAAEEYLSYAFQHCHILSRRNKRLILIYLIPVKMLLGYMPSLALLKKYDLMQFADVVKAVKEGNLLQVNEALEKQEAFFIKCGIYLILEKCKIITYRNLCKKVYLLLKTHQLPIDAFVVALRPAIPDIDADEAECILANLIFEGKIKGYISHQHQKLVVSKQNPFPALSAIS